MTVEEWFESKKLLITNAMHDDCCEIRRCNEPIAGIILRKGRYRLVCSKHYERATYLEVQGTVGYCRFCKDIALQVLEGRCAKHANSRFKCESEG